MEKLNARKAKAFLKAITKWGKGDYYKAIGIKTG